MNILSHLKQATLLTLTVTSIGLLSGTAYAEPTTTVAANSSTSTSAADQQKLTNIIAKGDQEITRRLTSLNTLSGKITAAAKLSAADKSYLTTEVNTEITGLQNLKTKLDADTTLASARADAQSIYTEYRVYALVLPKVYLVKTADDQQVVEGKLTALAQKLQTRIDAAKTNGKDTTALQNELNDLTAKTTAAQNISSSIEQKVLTLQPSDYNSDHALLSGYNAQLKTAHSDNEAAYADAKSIVATLKTL